ncbi:uncharacterized protein LOC125381692 [Haliotis rufescens]|uniref:uncharacterized protein LOC125381692 n=1 Tax=Haliotis rufescens TaxID=6454 RepID=UPI00201FA0F7|nr:uncharacterized protein LOC125381692 [Haliotis rufescens]
MDLEKIIKLGQSLGYEQNDLRAFVKEQTELEREKEKEKLEREERAREREIKKLELEERKEREKLEWEKEKLELEERKEREKLEWEKEKLELEERKEREKLEWEKEKLRVQSEERIELAKLEKSYAGNYEGQVGEKQLGAAAPKMPKMPPFDDRNDNIDAYLQRFERVAVAQDGLSLVVLKRLLKVKDLLLREQILNVTGRDLSIFLKERKPKDAMEMARLAEQFIEARGTGPVRYGKQGSFGQHDKTEVRGKPGENEAPGGTKPKPFIPIKERTCYNCSQIGHLAAQCKKPKYNVASIQVSEYTSNVSAVLPDGTDVEARIPEVVDGDATTSERVSEPDVASGSMFTTDHNMPIHKGKVNGKPVDVLRDSGCTGVIVRRSKVEDECLSSETQSCKLADSRVLILSVAWITVDTPFYTGKVRAACMDTPLCDLILGNIPGVREPRDPDQTWDKDDIQMVSAVETRGQRRVRQEGMKPLKALKPVGLTLSRGEFITQQQQDSSLDKVRKLVEEGKIRETRHSISSYYIENDMLYRKHTFTKFDKGKQVVQAVVPVGLRTQVMKVSHEALMGGHLGIKKTLDRVMSQFYWPGIMGDVRRHVLSCDICQRTTPKGKVRRIPLGQMPLIEVPFERIAVDLIGPLYPVTDKGNRYLLTVVDYATRYPEAVPLPRIETEYVAEALFEIFSRVGIPKEILTDMGAQFTSGVMKEVSRLLSLHQLTTTPYHPMCNGLVEKFNGTLKTMLKRMCAERPYDWDRYVAALLFAYREVPQESLGFAPFELLYGRTVRGPVQILREIWTKDIQNPEVRTTYEYVLDLQNRLEDTIHIAQQELKKKSGKYKKFFDAKSQARKMKVGDKVLLLLPTDSNKLLLQWKGPYEILEAFGIGNYRIQVGNKTKTYHANLLKKYIDREEIKDTTVCDVSIAHLMYASAGLVDVKAEEVSMLDIVSPALVSKETYEDVDMFKDLTEEQQIEVRELVSEFRDVLSDLPGKVDCMQYKIKLTCNEPIRSKPYPLPHHMRDVVAKEIQSMLDMGVIEPSHSPYASPIVLVKKADETYRFCTDFRKLNQVTVFDAEPIPLADSVFARLRHCKYLTKIDVSKAYWQIPMEESSKELTAFITPDGLYQWKVMPFGVVNAPTVFSRLMRQVLHSIPNTDNYIDDIIEGTEEWSPHVVSLRDIFTRLRQFHLTARPSKVKIGYKQLEFLGHRVGSGLIQPEGKNVEKILNVERPQTKKQVRALLGLSGYYRKFIPNYAAIAVPLTDLTKKGKSNKVVWTESQELAFTTLKTHMSSFPILKLPDLEKTFLVRSDASDVGIGAVLLQEQEGERFPILYVSRKLAERERAYSTIEKECLAIVWAIQKLERYLYGREFILETDHQPLVWMTKAKLTNGRVMRWALTLQPYRFLIRAIKGIENVGADLLSRCSP